MPLILITPPDHKNPVHIVPSGVVALRGPQKTTTHNAPGVSVTEWQLLVDMINHQTHTLRFSTETAANAAFQRISSCVP